MAEIREIKPAKERLAQVRRCLGRSVKYGIEQHDERLAGFALVTWNERGDAVTAYLTQFGPVGRSLMPTFVQDNLSRHVATEVFQETGGPERIEGGG